MKNYSVFILNGEHLISLIYVSQFKLQFFPALQHNIKKTI